MENAQFVQTSSLFRVHSRSARFAAQPQRHKSAQSRRTFVLLSKLTLAGAAVACAGATRSQIIIIRIHNHHNHNGDISIKSINQYLQLPSSRLHERQMGSTIKLSELNEFITCPLCRGYLIDASTVSECLHTFCRTCIIKHIKNDNNDCPKCLNVIHKSRPLDYIIKDRTTQDIVYKLVPQLYISELNRQASDEQHTNKSVLSHPSIPVINNSLEVFINSRRNTKSTEKSLGDPLFCFYCPPTVKVHHLKQLLRVKFQLDGNCRLNLYYKGDIICDEDFLSNLAQSLTFHIEFEVYQTVIRPPSVNSSVHFSTSSQTSL